jgi:hypothetical protein
MICYFGGRKSAKDDLSTLVHKCANVFFLSSGDSFGIVSLDLSLRKEIVGKR